MVRQCVFSSHAKCMENEKKKSYMSRKKYFILENISPLFIRLSYIQLNNVHYNLLKGTDRLEK